VHDDPLFDYSTLLLSLGYLHKKIHDCLLYKQYTEAAEYADELLVQSRFLQLWIKREMSES
jgi:hypothetical protein